MKDELIRLITEVLGTSTGEVNQIREALLSEQASGDARYAAGTALLHPEGSTTPLDEAYGRAQNRFADIRKKAEKTLPGALALLLALKIAEERRDEAKSHRELGWNQASAKDVLGVDPAVADWFARLHKHGVHPHHLKQQAAEMVAIIADLITWKAKDARFGDPDNPWRAVLQIYAGRRIGKPGTKIKAKRSVSGNPTRDRHHHDLGDYMFNEMVSASWPRVPTPGPQVSVDPFVTESDANFSVAPLPERADEFASVADMPAEPSQPRLELIEPAVATVDEYALPQSISENDAAMLHSAAEQWVVIDSEWEDGLKGAMGDTSHPAADVVDRVKRSTHHRRDTPFRYFIDEAQQHGVEAGRAAYRAATVRRFMHLFATDHSWKRVREGVGLNW